MNGKDIFLGLRYVDEAFIEEAEYGSFSSAAAKNAAPKQRRFRRPLLIAAIAALLLLLAGCAVAYVWSMQNLKIGEETSERAIYGTDGRNIVSYEEISQQILTLAGLKGTPNYQAALEWYEFKQEYDPAHTLQLQLIEADEVPEFPEEYFDYILYTQEMKDKLDAIMAEYDLKPLGTILDFRTVNNMCAALGIERLQTGQNDVTAKVDQGFCYSNGNFYLNLNFTLPEDADSQITRTWGNLHWYRKDCFCEDYIRIDDTGDWKEWNYATVSGEEVLILRSPSDWRGWILCDRGDAILSLQIEARKDLLSDTDGTDYLYLSDRQMELVADTINFGIQPKKVTQEDVDNQPAASNASTQDGYTVELKDVNTDGYIVNILLGITAPEGTVIRSQGEELYGIDPSNNPYLIPAEGETNGEVHGRYPVEDGDGLDNTHDFLLTAQIDMMDGSVPFAPGKVWDLHIEDLVHTYWDEENMTSVDEILAEGEWNFEITFGEENGDYREIELISQPVTVQASTWSAKSGDVIRDVEVTSFRLRSLSASIACECDEGIADLTCLCDGEILRVVMKDGSWIPLVGSEVLEAGCPIDLDQVDHVRMADGTKLMLPGEE